LEAGAMTGLRVAVATPSDYRPQAAVVDAATAQAARSGGEVVITDDPLEAAQEADVVYTDVWASMGQDAEHEARLALMRPYQVGHQVLEVARSDAIVMHCLPAHRGEEITADVIDGPQSVVWDQAENRLHSQKALLAFLLAGA
jgi:ornithine carbamoyltransferase